MYRSCPVCHHQRVSDLVSIAAMPVYCNVLHKTRKEALNAPQGDIDLVICDNCSHIYNRAFAPERMDYSVDYENSLHYSTVFSDYTDTLAQHLVDTHQLTNKNLVEIGCGKGDFLEALCAKGNNRGFGFDKSFDHERYDRKSYPHITFFQDFFGPSYADTPMDFLCCRHVLEHIQYPVNFINEISRISDNFVGMPVYFEVPNGLFTLRDFGIWDIIYEHCSYFTPLSLAFTFQSCGFDISLTKETFKGQFLSLEARFSPGQKHPLTPQMGDSEKAQLADMANAFSTNYHRLCGKWRHQLEEFADSGKKAAIWGSGSKGVTFLNVFKNNSFIEYTVDVNPHKQQKFIAGTGQTVVAPDFLRDYQPDAIIVMNTAYYDEIANMLSHLDIKAELLSV